MLPIFWFDSPFVIDKNIYHSKLCIYIYIYAFEPKDEMCKLTIVQDKSIKFYLKYNVTRKKMKHKTVK